MSQISILCAHVVVQFHSYSHSLRDCVAACVDEMDESVMMIELLTGLHPMVVRQLVDESLFEELPGVIKQYHDGRAPLPREAEKLKDLPTALRCVWPAIPLTSLSHIAARLTRLQPKMRARIAEVLPELEELASGNWLIRSDSSWRGRAKAR